MRTLKTENFELINGRIVNEFDETVGTYRHIANNKYNVILYNNHYELTAKGLVNEVLRLNLYLEAE